MLNRILDVSYLLCGLVFSSVLVTSTSVSKLRKAEKTETEKVILITCGTLNPITSLHLRIFEIARDHLHKTKQAEVIGGIISPVHELYKKPNTIILFNEHRHKMVDLALSSSTWIRQSDFEMNQSGWTPTDEVLRFHQSRINSILNGKSMDIPNWLPTNITKYRGQNVRLRLLSGADLLTLWANKEKKCTDHSKCEPWYDREIANILDNYGLIAISRSRSNPSQDIFFSDSDLLFNYRHKISIVDNWVTNDVSSKMIRVHLQRGLSVKYLMDDKVIDYIQRNKLYGYDEL